MARLTPIHLVPALIAAAATAGEVTVEPQPFTVEQTFSASALPASVTPIRLDAEEWSDFEISEIAAHGSRVRAGDVLVRFESKDFEKKLHDAREAVKTRALAIAQAELELASLEETTPIKLENLRRAARNAKEELAYFTGTRREAEEESAAQRLRRTEQMLANQREELSQLTKMYEADDLTEETEEIILQRQRESVAAAEFSLRMEKLNHERTINVMLPRESERLAESEKSTALALTKAEEELPRAIKIAAAELAVAQTAAEREKETLAGLEADESLFEIKAPAAGWFYYGPIENGRWTPGDVVKALVVGGKAPTGRAIATFIPADAKLGLVAFVDEPVARALSSDLAGTATLAGREEVEVPVKVIEIAAAPGPDGKYRVDLEATWPAGLDIAPAATAEVRAVSHHKPGAISLPVKALAYGPAGWTVEIKLADGKTEHRPVKRGRVSGETVEILEGLEPGQVVLVP